MHLQAVADGDINRLLMNVPPGFSKSMLTSVLWPAYCWTTRPELRFLSCSHNLELALRDSVRCRRLIQGEWYQSFWPIEIVGDVNTKGKFENTAGGFRQAVAAGSVTGARADHVIVDDPHSVESAMSDAMRQTTIDWFLHALPTRLNNPASSSISVIMQRLHTEDVSGVIIDRQLNYDHLMLPMEFDSGRRCSTSIGFEDPREEEGELLFPERFPVEVVQRDKKILGPYQYAGQFQQSPSPAGGGIIRRDWWQLWDDAEARAQGLKDANSYPAMDFILMSIDGAFTTKQENDASYITVFGLWDRGGSEAKSMLTQGGAKVELLDRRDTIPCVMLMYAKELRVPLHGEVLDRGAREDKAVFDLRQRDAWGLVEWCGFAAQKYNVDRILIEAKASGMPLADELKRLYKTASWDVELINPGAVDKVARAYAVQPIFANAQVWAPDKAWAESLISQAEVFPKGKHDDGVDATTQALRWMRDRNLLKRQDEIAAEINAEGSYKSKSKVIYDV